MYIFAIPKSLRYFVYSSAVKSITLSKIPNENNKTINPIKANI
jgi:hypothetical protein